MLLCSLSLSAFFASANGAFDLIHLIIPVRLHQSDYHACVAALEVWSHGHTDPPPEDSSCSQLKVWDAPHVKKSFVSLLDAAAATAFFRLQPVRMQEHGFMLSPSLGLCMDDDVIRVALGLRLGVPICHPHTCHVWSPCGSVWHPQPQLSQ